MANFFGKEDAVMRALAKVEDFDHDLRRTASTWANATCPSPWVDRLLDHEIGKVSGTYNLYAYVAHKKYVAYQPVVKVGIVCEAALPAVGD
jgi:integrase